MSELRDIPEEGLLHQPKNTLAQVKEVWAFVSVDPEDGNEGIVAASAGSMLVPLVAADRARLKDYWPLARRAAVASGLQVRLVRFSAREVVVDDVFTGRLP